MTSAVLYATLCSQLRRWIKGRRNKRKGISANLTSPERALSSSSSSQAKREQVSPQPKRAQSSPQPRQWGDFPLPKMHYCSTQSISAVRCTSEQSEQNRPTPDVWGWTSDEDSQSWVPVWNTISVASKACSELVKCSCKSQRVCAWC